MSDIIGLHAVQNTIGRVSKYRLFILDLLLCDHSCVSGDIALRIQHDVSQRHTKLQNPVIRHGAF